MEKYIDLHTHSIKSDGSMTPSELVRHAKANGLAAVALTDHDCTDGIKEALSEGDKIGIEVVSGVELSAISDTETHILGYLIDPNEKKFKAKMAEVLIMREKRNEETAEKLLSDSGRERGTGFFSVRKKAVAFLIAAVFFLAA